MSLGKRKAEDSADGCRALAQADRARAAAVASEHMRVVLENSADAWTARARLLDRLEKDFTKRATAARIQTVGRMKIDEAPNG